MALYPSTDKRPVYLDYLGNPLVYGRIYYYDTDGVTLKTVYSDKSLTTPATNSQLLNISGRTDTQIFLGSGEYLLKSYRYTGIGTGLEPEGDPLWVEDNQWYESGADIVAPQPTEVRTVDTITDLRDVAVGESVMLLGYYSKGDKTPILYTWNAASTTADNGGTVIESTTTPTGRWIHVAPGTVDAKIFGAGITNNPTNAEITAFLTYCYDSGRTAQFTAGTYRVTYAGDIGIYVSCGAIFDAGAYFHNASAGTVKLILNTTSIMVNTQGALTAPGSTGKVYFNIPLKMTFDIDPAWYGYVSFSDGSTAIAAISDNVSLDNVLSLYGTFTVTSLTGIHPLPVLRFQTGASFNVDIDSPNFVQFTSVIKPTDPDSGIVVSGTGFDLSTVTETPRTSWFTATNLEAIPTGIGLSTLIIDSEINLTTATTINYIITDPGALVNASARLTCIDVNSRDAWFSPSAGGLLKVTGLAYDYRWYAQGTSIGTILGDVAISGASNVLDMTGYDAITPVGLQSWSNASNIVIKGLRTNSNSNYSFAMTGTTVKSITFEDCSLQSTTTGYFITDLTYMNGTLYFKNSTVSLNTLYPAAQYGKLTNTVSASDCIIQIENSTISASKLFDGTVRFFLAKGSQLYGDMNLTSTNSFYIQGCNYGTSDTIYGPNNAFQIQAERINISASSMQRSNLKIYSRNGSLKDIVINGVNFQPFGPVYPEITMYATTGNVYTKNITITGNSFGEGDYLAPGSKTTVAFATSGGGSFNTPGNIVVVNNSASSVYNNTATTATKNIFFVGAFSSSRYEGITTPSTVIPLVFPGGTTLGIVPVFSVSCAYSGTSVDTGYIQSVVAKPSANTATGFGFTVNADKDKTDRTRSFYVSYTWNLYD